jgi:hypothetical protein
MIDPAQHTFLFVLLNVVKGNRETARAKNKKKTET